MKLLLWIVATIFIIIVAWPIFVFLLLLFIAFFLFSPKRVMVFRPQASPQTVHKPTFQPNDNVIDVEADVTIIEDEPKT